MVYAKLALLALIACLCQLSHAQTLRTRPGCKTCSVPRATPRVAPAPCRPTINNIGARYRYECNLERIISKLINALIYTVLKKDGGGVGGTAGTGVSSGGGTTGTGTGAASGGSSDSLLSLDAGLAGTELLDLDVLPGSSGDGGSGGGKRSGGLSLVELEVLERIFLNLGLLDDNQDELV